MKIFKTYIPVFCMLLGMSLSSCLKDQEDIFDQSSNVRMQEYLDRAKEVLVDAPNGWIFDYAPDRNLSYGMFLYTLQFTAKDVTVGSVLSPGEYEKSLYKLIDDNGPSLSFDSYNSLMHYFATPSWSHYQALDGDFEFTIMDIKPEQIILKGKRTGNFMYLTRMEEGVDPTNYVRESLAAAEKQYLVRASGTVGGKAVSAFLDLDVNYLELTFDDPSIDPTGAYFVFSPDGMRFPKPLEVNGVSVSGLDYSFDTATEVGEYKSQAGSQLDVKLNTFIPEDYAFIDEFSGAFTFDFGDSKVNCMLEPNAAEGTVLIKNLNPNYNFVTTYSKAYGTLSLTAQPLTMMGEDAIKLCSGPTSGFFQAPNMAAIQFRKSLDNPNLFKAELKHLEKSKECGFYMSIIHYHGDGVYLPPAQYEIDGACEFEIKSLTKK